MGPKNEHPPKTTIHSLPPNATQPPNNSTPKSPRQKSLMVKNSHALEYSFLS